MNNVTLFEKKKSFRFITAISILIIIVIAAIAIVVLYNNNGQAGYFIDKYIFRKEISSDNVVSILINSDDCIATYSFDKYIVLINKNTVDLYANSAKQAASIDITINNPIMNSKGRFLILGEKKGNKVYTISNGNIIWHKELEGEITGVNINKNGYAVVTLKQTSYKTVLVAIDPSGKELFTTYLASTYSIDVSISNDNKYIAISEINPNAAYVKSNVRIISIEKAKSTPIESVVGNFESESDELITGIEYNDKNKLLALYSNQISLIYDNEITILASLEDSNISFADICLSNNILVGKDVSTGIFSAYTELRIISIDSNKETIYNLDNVAKNIYTNDNIIAANMGTDVVFLNSSGWLIKKYTSRQEIKDVLLINNAAGIVYRDKIEIINL